MRHARLYLEGAPEALALIALHGHPRPEQLAVRLRSRGFERCWLEGRGHSRALVGRLRAAGPRHEKGVVAGAERRLARRRRRRGGRHRGDRERHPKHKGGAAPHVQLAVTGAGGDRDTAGRRCGGGAQRGALRGAQRSALRGAQRRGWRGAQRGGQRRGRGNNDQRGTREANLWMGVVREGDYGMRNDWITLTPWSFRANQGCASR